MTSSSSLAPGCVSEMAAQGVTGDLLCLIVRPRCLPHRVPAPPLLLVLSPSSSPRSTRSTSTLRHGPSPHSQDPQQATHYRSNKPSTTPSSSATPTSPSNTRTSSPSLPPHQASGASCLPPLPLNHAVHPLTRPLETAASSFRPTCPPPPRRPRPRPTATSTSSSASSTSASPRASRTSCASCRTILQQVRPSSPSSPPRPR